MVLFVNKGRFPHKKRLKSEPVVHFGGGGGSENRGAVHFFSSNIFMVAGFKHFPLVLDRLYKINPNFVAFFLEIPCIGEYYPLFRGQKIFNKSFFLKKKNYRRFTF